MVNAGARPSKIGIAGVAELIGADTTNGGDGALAKEDTRDACVAL